MPAGKSLKFSNINAKFNSSLFAGQMEKRDLQSEIDKVKQEINGVRFQVAKFIEQRYQVFDPLLVHSTALIETSAKLSKEVQQLADKTKTKVIHNLCVSQFNVNLLMNFISNSSLIALTMNSIHCWGMLPCFKLSFGKSVETSHNSGKPECKWLFNVSKLTVNWRVGAVFRV